MLQIVPSMAALKLPVLSELGREAHNLSLAGTGQLQEATERSLRNYTLNLLECHSAHSIY